MIRGHCPRFGFPLAFPRDCNRCLDDYTSTIRCSNALDNGQAAVARRGVAQKSGSIPPTQSGGFRGFIQFSFDENLKCQLACALESVCHDWRRIDPERWVWIGKESANQIEHFLPLGVWSCDFGLGHLDLLCGLKNTWRCGHYEPPTTVGVRPGLQRSMMESSLGENTTLAVPRGPSGILTWAIHAAQVVGAAPVPGAPPGAGTVTGRHKPPRLIIAERPTSTTR